MQVIASEIFILDFEFIISINGGLEVAIEPPQDSLSVQKLYALTNLLTLCH